MTGFRKLIQKDLLISVGVTILLAALAYLPLANRMGYYGDDWPLAYGKYTYGTEKIVQIYAGDRPFTGIVNALEYPLVGDSPAAWHIWEAGLRILGALGCLWLLRLLWPDQPLATASMAVLFAIYPGFLMMPTAIAYHALVLGVTFGIFSLALTAQAMRARRWAGKAALFAGSAILAAGAPLMFEWMVGFEAIRLVLIWYLVGGDGPQKFWVRVRRWFVNYLPILVPVVIFLFWRLILFKSSRAATDFGALIQSYRLNLRFMAARLVIETVKSFAESVLSAWFVPVYNATFRLDYKNMVFGMAIAAAGIIVFGLAAFWLWKNASARLGEDNKITPQRDWALEAIWVGAACTLLALIPVVVSGRGVQMGNSFDRYTLTAIMGVSILVCGGIFLAIKVFWQQASAIAILVGLSLLLHYANAVQYSQLAAYQNQFWWQLSWRAPDLKSGTVLIPYLPQGMTFSDDYDIFPEANLIYRPDVQDVQIAAQVLNRDTAKWIRAKASDSRFLRTMEFDRNYASSLIVSYGYDTGKSTCVHVLDGQQIELSQNENPLIPLVAASSNINQVLPDGVSHNPETVFFGPEPAHTWCYYYEKASLARQKGDWVEVVRLGDEALSRNYHAADPSEWMPFIEGYANLEKFDQARQLITRMGVDRYVQASLCRRFPADGLVPVNYARADAYQFIVSVMCK